jgi:phosphoribosylamine--glycine ligase
MNILLLGSGGREHALAWKIAQSPLVTKLFCAPGNAGIAQNAECVAVDISDHAAVIAFCRLMGVTFVVVGPDAPLAAGVVDDLSAAGIRAFGPTKAAGQLESSKSFTKALCRDHGIPTAAYAHFGNADAAKNYIRAQGAPIVVKADGLAAGKGVVVAMTLDEALAAVDMMFGGGFGEAGAEVVIEEFMEGEEASFFALCDGDTALALATAQDHKRVFDGDRGPNTGGMGAYSPAPAMTDALCARVMDEMIRPTLKAMREKGMPYKGVLYAGVMLTAHGPKLVEYNARFGDPECQVLMLRMESDIVPALIASAEGRLKDVSLNWSDDAALTVIMATKGYPGDYGKGSVIAGLDAAAALDGVRIFHAGTKSDGDHVLANGGRVLNVCATGPTVTEAQSRAYAAVDAIDWPESFCRRDIGWRAVERERVISAP